MSEQLKILALIPARGGSKRLPRKNERLLGGKPLLAWSIEAALKSKHSLRTVLSTDDPRLAEIGREFGAEVPFIRPMKYSEDESSSFSVAKHALEALEENFDYILLLQPTSPFRNSEHIDEAISLMQRKSADAIISVCPNEHSPLWSNTLPSDMNMDSFLRPELKGRRSQDLRQHYRLNGAIYLCKCKTLIEEGSFFPSKNSFAYVMNAQDSVDIDTAFDFELAEFMHSRKTNPLTVG